MACAFRGNVLIVDRPIFMRYSPSIRKVGTTFRIDGSGFLQATVAFGLARDDLRDDFSAYLNELTAMLETRC